MPGETSQEDQKLPPWPRARLITQRFCPGKRESIRKESSWGACLALSVEHATLDLEVVRLTPILDVEIT